MHRAPRRCEHRAMRSAAGRTEVLITVDVEFSIAGALTHPGIHAPLWDEPVHGRVDGRSEGLGFVLETLAAAGLPATFFVEALNHRYFGDAPMASVCRQLAAAGQDIQLHLHPVWTCFERGHRTGGVVDDACAGRGAGAAVPRAPFVACVLRAAAAGARPGVVRARGFCGSFGAAALRLERGDRRGMAARGYGKGPGARQHRGPSGDGNARGAARSPTPRRAVRRHRRRPRSRARSHPRGTVSRRARARPRSRKPRR